MEGWRGLEGAGGGGAGGLEGVEHACRGGGEEGRAGGGEGRGKGGQRFKQIECFRLGLKLCLSAV